MFKQAHTCNYLIICVTEIIGCLQRIHACSKVNNLRINTVGFICSVFPMDLLMVNQKSETIKVAQSSEQEPFTSEIVGSILATEVRSTLCRKSWVISGFLQQGKLTEWVRLNTVRKVISQLL